MGWNPSLILSSWHAKLGSNPCMSKAEYANTSSLNSRRVWISFALSSGLMLVLTLSLCLSYSFIKTSSSPSTGRGPSYTYGLSRFSLFLFFGRCSVVSGFLICWSSYTFPTIPLSVPYYTRSWYTNIAALALLSVGPLMMMLCGRGMSSTSKSTGRLLPCPFPLV